LPHLTISPHLTSPHFTSPISPSPQFSSNNQSLSQYINQSLIHLFVNKHCHRSNKIHLSFLAISVTEGGGDPEGAGGQTDLSPTSRLSHTHPILTSRFCHYFMSLMCFPFSWFKSGFHFCLGRNSKAFRACWQQCKLNKQP
jgi:hypothetical protein